MKNEEENPINIAAHHIRLQRLDPDPKFQLTAERQT
jgi:hypothetical protein